MRTSLIKRAVTATIRPICKSVFFRRGPAVYPRIECELKRLKAPSPVAQYILFLEYVGRIDDTDELEEIADRVFAAFDGAIHKDGGIIITAHSSEGEQSEIPDTAADIARISANIPLRVYMREE